MCVCPPTAPFKLNVSRFAVGGLDGKESGPKMLRFQGLDLPRDKVENEPRPEERAERQQDWPGVRGKRDRLPCPIYGRRGMAVKAGCESWDGGRKGEKNRSVKA